MNPDLERKATASDFVAKGDIVKTHKGYFEVTHVTNNRKYFDESQGSTFETEDISLIYEKDSKGNFVKKWER